jgi:hypothetical protein
LVRFSQEIGSGNGLLDRFYDWLDGGFTVHPSDEPREAGLGVLIPETLQESSAAAEVLQGPGRWLRRLCGRIPLSDVHWHPQLIQVV